jgi:hypothetical protein
MDADRARRAVSASPVIARLRLRAAASRRAIAHTPGRPCGRHERETRVGEHHLEPSPRPPTSRRDPQRHDGRGSTLAPSGCGGVGRRRGLKLLGAVRSVWVRTPPPARAPLWSFPQPPHRRTADHAGTSRPTTPGPAGRPPPEPSRRRDDEVAVSRRPPPDQACRRPWPSGRQSGAPGGPARTVADASRAPRHLARRPAGSRGRRRRGRRRRRA